MQRKGHCACCIGGTPSVAIRMELLSHSGHWYLLQFGCCWTQICIPHWFFKWQTLAAHIIPCYRWQLFKAVGSLIEHMLQNHRNAHVQTMWIASNTCKFPLPGSTCLFPRGHCLCASRHPFRCRSQEGRQIGVQIHRTMASCCTSSRQVIFAWALSSPKMYQEETCHHSYPLPLWVDSFQTSWRRWYAIPPVILTNWCKPIQGGGPQRIHPPYPFSGLQHFCGCWQLQGLLLANIIGVEWQNWPIPLMEWGQAPSTFIQQSSFFTSSDVQRATAVSSGTTYASSIATHNHWFGA